MTHLSETARRILKCLADGQTIGEILHHHADLSAHDIAAAAKEALHVDSFHRETTSRQAGETNLRTYEVWTADEDTQLEELLLKGEAIQDISKILQRHPMIVRRRIRQLKMDDYL